jgi:DNA-binding response OmpR family regulator
MKKPPAAAAHCARTIPVLCVDPCEEDHVALEDIFNNSPWSIFPDSLWTLQVSGSLKSAWSLLRAQHFPLVLCEGDLQPGAWRDLLDLLPLLPAPPFLIVTSRLADERLWAEALNLGAYDVLAKPFDGTEVMRVVSMAWMHWTEQHGALRISRLAVAGGRA